MDSRTEFWSHLTDASCVPTSKTFSHIILNIAPITLALLISIQVTFKADEKIKTRIGDTWIIDSIVFILVHGGEREVETLLIEK